MSLDHTETLGKNIAAQVPQIVKVLLLMEQICRQITGLKIKKMAGRNFENFSCEIN